jgi:hypothetical protein
MCQGEDIRGFAGKPYEATDQGPCLSGWPDVWGVKIAQNVAQVRSSIVKYVHNYLWKSSPKLSNTLCNWKNPIVKCDQMSKICPKSGHPAVFIVYLVYYSWRSRVSLLGETMIRWWRVSAKTKLILIMRAEVFGFHEASQPSIIPCCKKNVNGQHGQRFSLSVHVHFQTLGSGMRLILNFAPRGEVVLQGWTLSLGVKFSAGPSILLNSRECSPLRVYEGVNLILRGQISPLGAKFTPGGKPCC